MRKLGIFILTVSIIPISLTALFSCGNGGGGSLRDKMTFTIWHLPTFADPKAIAIGDINGDGKNDVVATTTSNSTYPNYSNRLLVFKQNSIGGLEAPIILETPGGCRSIDIGDLDSDHRNDVAMACLDSIGVYYQNISGEFDSLLTMPSDYIYLVRIGDVTDDGLNDVVTAGTAVNIFTQNDQGNLNSAQFNYIETGGRRDLEIGDLDSDNKTDVAVMTGNGGFDHNALAVLFQDLTHDPTILTNPVYYNLDPTSLNPNGMGLGDVNADGHSDIVLAYGGNWPDSKIAIFYQNGSQSEYTLDPPVIFPAYDIPYAVEIADFDGDGLKDILVEHAGWNAIGVYFQNHDGEPSPYLLSVPDTQLNVQGMAIGDLNDDLKLDIVYCAIGEIIVVYRE